MTRVRVGWVLFRDLISAKKLRLIDAGQGFVHSIINICVNRCAAVTIALSAMILFYLPGSATGGTGTIPASVQIKIPLKIISKTDLDFGKVCPGKTNGTVVVTTGDNRFPTGGATISPSNFHRAAFDISGDPNAYYGIIVTAGQPVRYSNSNCDCCCNCNSDHNDGNVSQPGGKNAGGNGQFCNFHGRNGNNSGSGNIGNNRGNGQPCNCQTSLQVINLKSFSATIGSETATGRIAPNGTDRIFVGGTLVVATTACGGAYRCDVELTINY